MGAVVGTIALIAIPSLIFGFWPQIKRASELPAHTGGSPRGRGWRRERTRYWDPSARSLRQTFYLWVWLVGCFPVGLLLLVAQEPEGREKREWVNVCPGCGLRKGSGHTSDCPRYAPPPEPAPAQPPGAGRAALPRASTTTPTAAPTRRRSCGRRSASPSS
jgi:hypothetical protein